MVSHLSEKIKYQIILRGMTVTEFANKYNIVRNHIDNILYGRSKNPEIIMQIAEALQIPFEYLLYEKDDKATESSKEREMDKFKQSKKFDILLFKETVNAVANICIEQNLDISQKRFYDNLEEIYHYAVMNKYNLSQVRPFAEIIINYSVKYNKIKKRP